MTLVITIPPGLTCAACHTEFTGTTATPTKKGYVHTVSCFDGDRPGRIDGWCKVDDCNRVAKANGWCHPHYGRWRRHGDPLAGRNVPAIVIEDIEFMVETGESATGAARRLGRTRNTLEQALKRAGRYDLFRALAAREGDWNSPARYGRRQKQGAA